MASGHSGFPPPLTSGGDPAAPGNVAQGLEALAPSGARVAEAVAHPPAGEIRHRLHFSRWDGA